MMMMITVKIGLYSCESHNTNWRDARCRWASVWLSPKLRK